MIRLVLELQQLAHLQESCTMLLGNRVFLSFLLLIIGISAAKVTQDTILAKFKGKFTTKDPMTTLTDITTIALKYNNNIKHLISKNEKLKDLPIPPLYKDGLINSIDPIEVDKLVDSLIELASFVTKGSGSEVLAESNRRKKEKLKEIQGNTEKLIERVDKLKASGDADGFCDGIISKLNNDVLAKCKDNPDLSLLNETYKGLLKQVNKRELEITLEKAKQEREKREKEEGKKLEKQKEELRQELERLKKEKEERIRKEEEEREKIRKAEEERRAEEEREKIRRAEEEEKERLRKEEERIRKENEERLRKEKEEREKQEKADKEKRAEEEERIRKENEERLKKEEEERLKQVEKEKREKEKKEQEDKEKREKEEERLRKEQEDKEKREKEEREKQEKEKADKDKQEKEKADKEHTKAPPPAKPLVKPSFIDSYFQVNKEMSETLKSSTY